MSTEPSFAARIIKLCDAPPNSKAGRHVAGQLLRSGTSPAPQHDSARSAESPREFIHKLKIAVKELNETDVWLRIVLASDMMKEDKPAELLDEGEQLRRMRNATIGTARKIQHQTRWRAVYYA